MPHPKWSIQDLKTALNSHPKIKGWIVKDEYVQRFERYFLSEPKNQALAVDQDRRVSGHSIQTQIWVRLGNSSDAANEKQGETTKTFFLKLPLKEQIDAAVEAALLAEQKSWELPTHDLSPAPDLKTVDPEIHEAPDRVIQKITSDISETLRSPLPANFNSAELFVSLHESETLTHTGFHDRKTQSRVYLEAAFSSKEDEFMTTKWAVSLKDVNVKELFRETAERASKTGTLPKPESGRYSVIIDSDVLLLLFHDLTRHLLASSSYQGLPFKKPGSAFIDQPKSDRITLKISPDLDFGADTTAFSNLGLKQVPLELIRDNQVIATLSDPQYASYLGLKTTSERGDLVLAPGSHSFSELTQMDDQVLEILQFSGLFTDAPSGTYSSEIRLARLYDRKKKTATYLKGGSVSGNIFENFKDLLFSKETLQKTDFTNGPRGYQGPAYALMRDVVVVG